METGIIAYLLNGATKPVVVASTLEVVAHDRAWAQAEFLDHVVVVVDNFTEKVEVEFSAAISPEVKRALWAAVTEVVAAALR